MSCATWTYSASARCSCGAGLAFRRGDRQWACAVVLGQIASTATPTTTSGHTGPYNFLDYAVRPEDGTLTTRGASDPAACPASPTERTVLT